MNAQTPPPAYKAPDPAAWQRKYNCPIPPYPVAEDPCLYPGSELTPGFLNTFIRSAQLAVERDWSRLTAGEAHRHQAALDCVCERVATLIRLDDAKGDIFFNPADNRFWIYPR